MNTYAKVQSLITAWKSQSLSRTDLIRAIAEACLGWPYGSAMGTVLLAHFRNFLPTGIPGNWKLSVFDDIREIAF